MIYEKRATKVALFLVVQFWYMWPFAWHFCIRAHVALCMALLYQGACDPLSGIFVSEPIYIHVYTCFLHSGRISLRIDFIYAFDVSHIEDKASVSSMNLSPHLSPLKNILSLHLAGDGRYIVLFLT